jgi:predicted permease
VILSIGLGLGLNVTLLALVRGVLLRPLGVAESDRLYSLYLSDARRPRLGPFPYPVHTVLRESNGPVSNVVGFVEFQEPVIIDGSAELVTGEFITPNYFESLGVRAVLGRAITPSDDRSADSRRVVVVSERFWRNRLEGGRDWLGRQIQINSQDLTLVGVMPSNFRGMNLPGIAPSDAWILFSAAHEISPRFDSRFVSSFAQLSVRLRAKLPDGVTAAVAQRHLNELLNHLGKQHRNLAGKVAIVQRSDKEMLFPGADGPARSAAGALLGLSFLVLLIVAANVTHLFLSRVIDRLPDIATRRVLGAGRLRAAAPVFREAAWLMAFGVLVSVVTATLFSSRLTRGAAAYGRSNGLSFDPLIDWSVYVQTLMVAVGLATLCISAPALLATRDGVIYSVLGRGWMPAGGRWSRRTRAGLVGAQCVIAAAVVVIAATFFHGATEVAMRDIGLESDAVLVGFDARRSPVYRDPKRLVALHQQLQTRVSSLPGVTRATLIDFLPVGTRRGMATLSFGPSPDPSEDVDLYVQRVGPGYFDIVKTPVVAGRAFTDTDVAGQPMVAMVSETAAREIWKRPSPLGETVLASIQDVKARLTIVGVARDTDVRFIGERHWPLLYVPFSQHPSPEFHVVADALGVGPATSSLIAAQAKQIDPRIPIVRFSTVNEWIDTWIYPYRLAAVLTGSFALVAWVVSAVGVFGLAHYWTSTRTREFGLRQALGASPRRILALVVRQQVMPVLLATVVGLAAGGFAVTMTARVFFKMVAFNAGVVVVVGFLAVAVAIIAIAVAARTVISLNPSEALRRP